MPSAAITPRAFEPGTTGWTADDLDDPEIERQWGEGRYEIIEGVLTTVAPAYFVGGKRLLRLIYRVTNHIGEKPGSFAAEVEIVIDEARVVRADAAFLTPGEWQRQTQAARDSGRHDPMRTRILIPPTLIIECISPGHEKHDERTKCRWYAEFGVGNYWLLDPFKKTLKCLVLRKGKYVEDAAGEGNVELRPSLFPGLVLQLGEIWSD